MEEHGQAQAAPEGNRCVERPLWRTTEAAGFQHLDPEVMGTHSDAGGTEPSLAQMDPDRSLPPVEVGLLSEQDLGNIRVARAKLLNSPQAGILSLSLMVCGDKPSPPLTEG